MAKDKMKYYYCPNCLSTNLRPNGWFNEGELCFPCQSDKNSVTTDYSSRVKRLRLYIESLSNHKENNTRYDCIVGVSGGKDSTRQALWVRDRLGMRPLLVCVTYPPIQSTELGKKNLSNLVDMGFDIVTFTPAPKTSERLTRESFFKFGNVSKATEKVLHSEVPRIALMENIKLIFWGDNQATQTGDMATLGDSIFDGNNLRNMNTLVDGGDEWIKDIVKIKNKYDPYFYPDYKKLKNQYINTVYLGPALDRWTMLDNSIFSILFGLLPNENASFKTGDMLRTSMLDEEYTNINMMIKYYKFGFGRTTDLVNGLIRDNSMSRKEAIELAEDLDGMCSDEIIDSFCRYINITNNEFWNVVYKFTNRDLFFIQKGKRPAPRFKVGTGII